MSSSSTLSPENQQKPYISKRTPDLSRRRRNIISEENQNSQYSPSNSSPSDIVLEPFGQSASGRWLRISEPVSHPLPDFHSDLFNFMAGNELKNVSTFKVNDTNQEGQSPMILSERSYTVNENIENMSKVPLPQSAALFYNGHSPMTEIIESCDGIYRLNNYLKSRKQDVQSGVPGRFLQAVVGPEICDVGSIVSTIMYAFYLNETQQSEQLCAVPVINTKRADLDSHGEINWLLESCRIDHSSLVFADEIDLSYYDLFGSLKLVLVNSSQLPAKQEVLREALVEIVSCKGEEALSCCTIVAEKFALACPEILVGRGFSRLLLAGILLDTGNLTSSKTTSKDKYNSTLLLNGAGRFGCGGLYQIMRHKMFDVLGILHKDLKKWTKKGKSGNDIGLKMPNVGMVSIGISIPQLLSLSSTSDAEIARFQQMEKLSLLVIVSGYYDSEKNFKREVLVSGESYEILKGLVQFIRSNAPELPLKAMHQPDLKFEMRVFEVDKVTSRKTIERLLEEFIEMS